jgi:hypothetical protein
MPPIRLTDDELDAVLSAARPLPVAHGHGAARRTKLIAVR